MNLSEMYEKGRALLKSRDFGFCLDGVETQSVLESNRRAMARYTFRQKCIDAPKPSTSIEILGVTLRTPVIMAAMTAPIPGMIDEGLVRVAYALKAAGSLMWTGMADFAGEATL